MCFSANASFTASAVLGTIGVIALTKVNEPRQIPFAVIPLMFAVQQVSEGMLWIGLSDATHESWRHFPVYIFLVFAQLIWPSWVPFSTFLLEENRKQKKLLMIALGMGLSISLYLLYCLFNYEVGAEIQGGHIHYTLNFPSTLVWIAGIMYFIPTVISLFISTTKGMRVLGLAILLSYIVTKLFFEDYFISVWCFFAACLSMMVLWITALVNKREAPLSDTAV